jgi:hypothetical protein
MSQYFFGNVASYGVNAGNLNAGNLVVVPSVADATTESKKTVDIVVARFDENIEWLNDLTKYNVLIYDKHPTNPVVNACERLPNVGREGHTYLHHILKNYDRLADITVFLQGCISDHLTGNRHPVAFVEELISEASSKGYSTPRWALPADPQFRHTSYFGKQLTPANESFGSWFRKFICPDFPNDRIVFYKNGLFAVHKSFVTHRLPSYYLTIKNQLLDEDGEAGHFLERSWLHIFTHTTSKEIQS